MIACRGFMNEAVGKTHGAISDQVSHAVFPSTHWSRILTAGASGRGDSRELDELCRAYWSPLYAFLRRQGHLPPDAEDLVQGFLARLLAREDLAVVSPERGRFRTFLLASLRNFVIKQALRDKAVKRGGGQAAISMDVEEAEQMCGPEMLAPSPEAAFDQRFARTLIRRAFAALEEEHLARGKGEFFAAVAPYLDGNQPEGYEDVGARLGMPSGTVAVAVHRLRGRLRELLRAEIRELCSTPEEAAQEMEHLMSVWSR